MHHIVSPVRKLQRVLWPRRARLLLLLWLLLTRRRRVLRRRRLLLLLPAPRYGLWSLLLLLRRRLLDEIARKNALLRPIHRRPMPPLIPIQDFKTDVMLSLN